MNKVTFSHTRINSDRYKIPNCDTFVLRSTKPKRERCDFDIQSDFGYSRSIASGTTYFESASTANLLNPRRPVQDGLLRSSMVNNSYTQNIRQTTESNGVNCYSNAIFSMQFNGCGLSDRSQASQGNQSLDDAASGLEIAAFGSVPNVQAWTSALLSQQPHTARSSVIHDNRNVLDLAGNINDQRWAYIPAVLPTVREEVYEMSECPYCDFRYPRS